MKPASKYQYNGARGQKPMENYIQYSTIPTIKYKYNRYYGI